MNGTGNNIRILVAPLDWGLGHAARCVPIIGELHLRGCEVALAADGAAAKLLAREFPQLQILQLPGYAIRYGKMGMLPSILLQLPRIFRTIKRERKWLDELLKKEHFDVVISDNRPGFWNSRSHCIYITHQLRIQSGISEWIDDRLQKLHTRYMNRFHEVWVPDFAGSNNLSGKLSHPVQQMIQPVYMGLLSRLVKKQEEKKYELMILLSGPEPQRTIFESKLLRELKSVSAKVLLVRGLPSATDQSDAGENITVCNHLTASQLEEAIQQSELIICRSGYTTLMDLLKLRSKAVLVPTPGQTEQEYLAFHANKENLFPYIIQQEFTVKAALQVAANFHFQNSFAPEDFEHYRQLTDELLESLKRS
ncbi:MAG: glycosyl transferase family 28 [Chitinophagaceae bacterium]|nr:glycosyl transferase family 28 [Chitinophagaceae bacterium]